MRGDQGGRRQSGEDGATLIELMVALLVLGALSAIAVPSFLSERSKAAATAAQANLRSAWTAAQTALLDNSITSSSTAFGSSTAFASYMQAQEPALRWDAGPVEASGDVSVSIVGQAGLASKLSGANQLVAELDSFVLTSSTTLPAVNCSLPYGGNYMATVSGGTASVALSSDCQSGPYYLEVYSAPWDGANPTNPSPPGCGTGTVYPNSYCSYPSGTDFPQSYVSTTKFSPNVATAVLPSGCWQLDVVNSYSGAPGTIANIVSNLGGNLVWGESGGSCNPPSSGSGSATGPTASSSPAGEVDAVVLSTWSISSGGTCWSTAQVNSPNAVLNLEPGTYFEKSQAPSGGCDAASLTNSSGWSKSPLS